MTQLIQIADDHGTNTRIVRLIGRGIDELIPLFTYMISESDNGQFFLQIASPNRNLSRFAPNPFDTISLSQMLALVEDQGYEKDAIVANITYYDASIEGVIGSDGAVSTPYVRPTTGALAREATTQEIVSCLQLPEGTEDSRRIGLLARSGESQVPINLDRNVLNHHILVAGSTGSGKSHLLSNIAHVAAREGRCVILFDHKPDHQNHHEENPDSENPQAFSTDGNTNYPAVRYWTLDHADPNGDSIVLRVRAQDLSPELLAATIFHRDGEDNQAEVYSHITEWFSSTRRETDTDWSIQELNQYIRSTPDGQLDNVLYGEQSSTKIPRATLNAIRSKMGRPGRIPLFVDASPPPDALGRTRTVGNVDDVFQPGLNVIRINEDNARAYALFLSRLLQRAEAIRTVALQQSGDPVGSVAEMEIIIDEAADIFRAPSRYLRNAASSEVAEQIRKGRSLRIGYVIAVQSAGDVPENIRNNLNTTIIGRHRNLNVLRDALPTAQTGMLDQADRLLPGEMFVDMFGVRSLLSVQMDLSRSKLTVVD